MADTHILRAWVILKTMFSSITLPDYC